MDADIFLEKIIKLYEECHLDKFLYIPISTSISTNLGIISYKFEDGSTINTKQIFEAVDNRIKNLKKK